MESKSFCYWLQGFFELVDKGPKQASYELTHKQVETIRNHLAMVFKHEIDPRYGDAKHQDELNKIHNQSNVVLPKGPVNITQEGLDNLKKMQDDYAKKQKEHDASHSAACDCNTLIRC